MTATPSPEASASATPKPEATPSPTVKPARTPDKDVFPGPQKIRKTAIPVGEVPRAAGPAGDEVAVRKALKAFLSAVHDGNGFRACAQFTRSGRKAVERNIAKVAPETAGAPCEQSLLLFTSGYGDAIANPKIRAVRVNGNTATAVGPLKERAKLTKTDDLWRIDRYGNATGP